MAALVLQSKFSVVARLLFGYRVLYGLTHLRAVLRVDKVQPDLCFCRMRVRCAAHHVPPLRRQVIAARFQVPVPGAVAAAF